MNAYLPEFEGLNETSGMLDFSIAFQSTPTPSSLRLQELALFV